VYFTSREQALLALRGTVTLPPQEFQSTVPALRVAVGMDFALRAGWAVRYSFSETIQNNPISEQLSPPGLFGISKSF